MKEIRFERVKKTSTLEEFVFFRSVVLYIFLHIFLLFLCASKYMPLSIKKKCCNVMFLQFQLFKFPFQHFLFPNIGFVLIGLLQNHLSYMTRPLSSNGSLPFRTRGDIPSLTPVLSKSVATEA